MKFLPSLKSAKSLALVAVTIATSIASSIAPSQAEQPTMIVRQSGHLQEYVYFPQANRYFGLPSNCPAVRELFSGALIKTEGFLPLPGNMGTFLCNSELQGFTSPAFGSNAGVILLGGDPYYVKSDAFFKAMKITPTKLTEQQGKDFISGSPRFDKSFVLETRIAPPAPPAPAPVPPPVQQFGRISFFNRGAYVTRYEITMDVGGGRKFSFKTGNIGLNKNARFSTPTTATNIKIVGEYYTGFLDNYKVFLTQNVNSASDQVCVTSTRSVFNPKADNTCN